MPLFDHELATVASSVEPSVTGKHGTMRKQLTSALLLIILALNICTSNGHYDLRMRKDADAIHDHRHHLHQKQAYGYHAKMYSNAKHQNVKYGKALRGNGKTYSDKKQLIAFLLSLIFFGAGRIYVEHYIIGSIQMFLLQLLLFLIWSVTVISCFYRNAFGDRVRNRNSQNTPTGYLRQWMLLSIFWVPLFLVVFIWWIHDIASFSMNDIADANGLKLQPW